MEQPGRRVTLSKADRNTPVGQELIALLQELSADGMVSRDELERLREWLRTHEDAVLPARGFLGSVVDAIAADGVITEDELDSLAQAIERVLPSDLRFVPAMRRKEQRAARRAEAQKLRAEQRAAEKAGKQAARELARPLERADFVVAGATRGEDRREACEALSEGDDVELEREPDNRHDGNAILVLSDDGSELGYVPREDARRLAPLLDAGARCEATVKRLLETRDGHTLPVVVATVYRADAPVQAQAPSTAKPQTPSTKPAQGCASALLGLLMIAALIHILASLL